MPLTDADFIQAAAQLDCDVPAIRAVDLVESGGRSGFLASGRALILCEAHKFSKWTKGVYDRGYPEISSPTWNKALYYGGEAEWKRFRAMTSLNADAGYKSTSYGRFQILGENYAVCGFKSAENFAQAQMISESAQLNAFVHFVIGNSLDDALREHRWPDFARGYNGTAYKLNNYDTKLADAHARFSAGGEAAAPRGVLRLGMSGTAVVQLQRLLITKGFKLVSDGVFGRATQNAVEVFQERAGLVADGIVGPATREALTG